MTITPLVTPQDWGLDQFVDLPVSLLNGNL